MNEITLLSAAPGAGATSTPIPTLPPAKPGTNSKSPHCKVCGDESSGFHYGVDSCEGCKGFFRRCITQGMTHKCANEEKCEITPFTRNSCQYCRLKKCFEVGMSREASRLGRRPKRLKDVSGDHGKSHGNLPIAPYPTPAEMYRLRMAELQKLLQANGTFKAELMEAFLSAAQASFRDHAKQPHSSDNSGSTSNVQQAQSVPQQQQQQQTVQIQQQQVVQQQQQQQIQHAAGLVPKVESGYSSLSSPSSSHSQSPSQDPNLLLNNSTHFMDSVNMFTLPRLDENVLSMTSPSNSVSSSSFADSSVLSPIDDALSLDSCFNELLMESVTIKSEPSLSPCNQGRRTSLDEYMDILKEAQKPPSETRLPLIKQVTEAVINAHFATCLNSYESIERANNTINSNIINVPDFASKCMDPDTVWKQFLNRMVPELTNVVKFCKKLPGFFEIEQDDQVKLIKQGSFEVLLARFSMLVNSDRNEMIDPSLTYKCPRHVVVNMPLGFLLEEFFHVAEQFNPLSLTDGEIALFTSTIIICPERQNLKNKLGIKKIQGLFQQALYQQLCKNHPDPDQLFLQLLAVVPNFQRINEQHSMALNNIKMNSPEAFGKEFPELHREVFDQST